MVPRSLQGLILGALHDVEPNHLVVNLFLELFKVDDQLVAVLIESWTIFALNESVDLEFLIDHSFYLLHGLKD